MKGKTTAVACLLLAMLLSGCKAEHPDQTVTTHTPAISTQTSLPEETVEVPQEHAAAESAPVPETEPEPVAVETPYGTLYYQHRWDGIVQTEQNMTENVLCVTFFAEIEGTQYRAFSVIIGGPEANAGRIRDGEGAERNVCVSMEDLGDLSALTDDQRDMLYALQEEINFVTDKLT